MRLEMPVFHQGMAALSINFQLPTGSSIAAALPKPLKEATGN
jgi:hypothetical protein